MKKGLIIFTLGAVTGNLLLALRMLNPVLLREALFYLENYGGLYFFLHGMVDLALGLIGYAVLILIGRYYDKRHKSKERSKKNG